jgi:GTPase SAR1 family protein
VILVYDVGQKDSFDALDSWLAEMKQELGPHGNMDNIVFVVCANKVTALNGFANSCAFEDTKRKELGM